jgi:hypothetical protein
MNAIRPLIISASWILAMQPLAAELPTLNKAPFVGLYAGFQNKRIHITVSHKGMLLIRPFNNKGNPVIDKIGVKVELGVEEVPANGPTIWRALDFPSLSSKQPETDNFQKTEITGKVSGGASFVATIENQRGTITINGHVTDPGPLTKNPLRMCIRIVFPDPYPYSKATTEKGKETFQEQLEDDRLQLRWSDGNRKKFNFADPVDAKSKDVNGPGISEAMVEVSAYENHKFRIIAGANAQMLLRNAATAPLRDGFEFRWFVPDAAKDPKHQATLTIE